MKVQRSIDIESTPEKVWPFLVEPDKIMKWCFTLSNFEYKIQNNEGVGAEFKYIEKGKTRNITVECIVTKWIENKRISFKMTKGTGLKQYDESWIIDEIPSGIRFRFIQNSELPYGIIGKLMVPISRKRAEATVHKMLLKLKSGVEKETTKH